jgi:hypothetical protein
MITKISHSIVKCEIWFSDMSNELLYYEIQFVITVIRSFYVIKLRRYPFSKLLIFLYFNNSELRYYLLLIILDH